MIIFNLNDGKTYEMEDCVCNMSNILKECIMIILI